MGHQAFLLLTMILLLVAMAVVYGQPSTSGFISIDCGQDEGYKYNDTKTGIMYVSDFDFVDTGEIHTVPVENRPTGDPYPEQMNKLRSFPNGTRNCYRMKPVRQGVRYLVRLQFLYGNYDGKNHIPTFDIYLGINFWYTITRNFGWWEAVVTATSESISVCLVNTDKGTPFISSIELRPLPGTIYPGAMDSTNQLMIRLGRPSYGRAGVVRYPNDVYDRYWRGQGLNGCIDVKTSSNIHRSISNNGFETPTDVMTTAVSPENGSSSIDLNLSVYTILQQKYPSVGIYCAMHFAEIEDLKSSNDTRNFRILWNEDILDDDITLEYLSTQTYYTRKIKPYEPTKLSITSTDESTKPPIINALEYYAVVNITQPETDVGDNNAILRFKGTYDIKRNWNGDPCLPIDFRWDGLNCSNDRSSSPRIISLNLSSSNLIGEIAPWLAILTKLQSLDLSSNGLTGEIPSFLASLSHLELLNLTRNNLRGSIPKELLDRSASGSLKLSTEENPLLCTNPDSCKKGSNKIVIIVVCSVGVVLVVLALVLVVVWRLRRQQVPLEQIQSHHRTLSLQPESKQFTFHEIVEITNNFSKQIGRGGFGTVYHGICKNGIEVAVKMLSCSSSQGAQEFHTEALLLTRIHHRNLVSLIGYCDDIDHLALVYEYMAGGNLADYLAGKLGKEDTFCWRERLRIASEAAQGLEYLHKGCKPVIIHRDIKTSNILLTQNLGVRIADFGLSKIFQTDSITHVTTKIIGTRGYIDPKYHNSNHLNEKSDVYSFGIVLMELITGLPAITKPENIHIARWVQERVERGEIREIIDKRLKEDYDINSIQKVVDKAIACTTSESQRRPSISKVLALLNDCLESEMAYENSQSVGNVNLDGGNSLEIKASRDLNWTDVATR